MINIAAQPQIGNTLNQNTLFQGVLIHIITPHRLVEASRTAQVQAGKGSSKAARGHASGNTQKARTGRYSRQRRRVRRRPSATQPEFDPAHDDDHACDAAAADADAVDRHDDDDDDDDHHQQQQVVDAGVSGSSPQRYQLRMSITVGDHTAACPERCY